MEGTLIEQSLMSLRNLQDWVDKNARSLDISVKEQVALESLSNSLYLVHKNERDKWSKLRSVM